VTCPSCGVQVSKPATEGGIIVKAAYIRVTTAGKILFACATCKSELERVPATGRLVLFQRRPSKPSSAIVPSGD